MRLLSLMLLAALAACSSSSDAKDGDPCGSVTCSDGLVCCSESCGLCGPPDGSCPAIECEDPDAPLCEAMDAASEGDCDTEFGYAFDGEGCVHLSGCSCEGEDCDALFEDVADCENACEPSEDGDLCGGITEATCSPGYYCEYEAESACTGEGTCRLFSPSDCFGVPTTVCGCDGQTYASACQARAAGTDVATTGACEEI
jgi:hypothetical protein